MTPDEIRAFRRRRLGLSQGELARVLADHAVEHPPDVRHLRGSVGLTQAELAAALGVGRVTIARWETGRQHPTGPAARLLRLLALRPELLALLLPARPAPRRSASGR